MSKVSSHKIKNIFISLKESIIGRISDEDIKLLKDRFSFFEKCRYQKIDFYKGYAKPIFYYLTKDKTYPQNKQWLRIKNKIDNDNQFFYIGTTYDIYKHKGKDEQYYKYFRYYHKYRILELVSDYYNKIPIFFHLSSTGQYEFLNNIEYIEEID